MRELVYLSQSKLQQFAFGRTRRRFGRAQVEGEIGVPGLAAVKVTPAAPIQDPKPAADLEKVISWLESSGRAAQRFTDERVQAGQWVTFSAPLSYAAIGGAVFFLDSDQPTPDYPTGGTVRLMLHGSREHLIGSSPHLTRDEAARYLGYSSGTVFRLLRELDLAANQADGGADGSDSPQSGHEFAFPSTLNRFTRRLGSYLHLEYTAAWMAGYARVTAVVPDGQHNRIVLATPLFVEYILPPAEQSSL